MGRFEEYGKRVTGVDMPPRVSAVKDQFQGDPYISMFEAEMVITEARRKRTGWFLDVAKCGISDLVGRAVYGGRPQYNRQNDIVDNGEL